MAAIQQLPILPTATSQSVAALGTRFSPKDHRSVKAMATEFEGMFLSQLLKEMRGTLKPGTMFAGDNSDIEGGLFDMLMSKHLAEAGGVGLAAKLQQMLSTTPQTGSTTNAKTTGQPTAAASGTVSVSLGA